MVLGYFVYYSPLLAAGLVAAAVMVIPAFRRRLPRTLRFHQGSRPDRCAGIIVGAAAALQVVLAAVAPLQRIARAQANGRYGSWWAYADGLIAAVLAVLAVAILLQRFRSRPHEPVPPVRRRTWRSFSSHAQLVASVVGLMTLLGVVLFAGSISSRDAEGGYRVLRLDSGRETLAHAEFFGWTYGVPVALAAIALAGSVVMALHANAVRPYLKTATVEREDVSRSALAGLLSWFVVASLAIALSRALMSVASAAQVSVSTEVYSWSTGLEAVAPWLTWIAVGLQGLAYTAFLLVACSSWRWVPPTMPEATAASGPSHTGAGTAIRG